MRKTRIYYYAGAGQPPAPHKYGNRADLYRACGGAGHGPASAGRAGNANRRPPGAAPTARARQRGRELGPRTGCRDREAWAGGTGAAGSTEAETAARAGGREERILTGRCA